MTVHKAEQKHVLIEVNCKCGHPDSFQDMVACDGCDHWFHLSCVSMEVAPWAIGFVQIVRLNTNISFAVTK